MVFDSPNHAHDWASRVLKSFRYFYAASDKIVAPHFFSREKSLDIVGESFILYMLY